MDMVVPFCGSARTSIHNQVFLEGVKSAMLAAKGIASSGPGEGGVSIEDKECRTWSNEEKDVGMKAFGRGCERPQRLIANSSSQGNRGRCRMGLQSSILSREAV